MLRWIIRSALNARLLAAALAAALIAVGVVAFRSMPADVLPEFAPPTVEVQTEALGLSASEVEQLITVPVEQDLLAGVPWLDTIRSESMTGLSSIEMTFDPGTNVVDVYVGRLREKIDADHEPKLLQTVRGMGYVLKERP